jgi:hypothetical protein
MPRQQPLNRLHRTLKGRFEPTWKECHFRPPTSDPVDDNKAFCVASMPFTMSCTIEIANIYHLGRLGHSGYLGIQPPSEHLLALTNTVLGTITMDMSGNLLESRNLTGQLSAIDYRPKFTGNYSNVYMGSLHGTPVRFSQEAEYFISLIFTIRRSRSRL